MFLCPWPDHRWAILIFGLLAAVFLQSPVTYVGDSKYTLLLSESLLERGTFSLDGYGIPHRPPGKCGTAEVNGDIYQVEVVDGHFRYFFPPGSSILSLPFVALMNLSRPIVGAGGYDFGNETKVQAKLAAYLMAALGAVFFYTARLTLPVRTSFVLALGATLGTQIWSTASRAIWGHTWGVFLLGCAVYLLAAAETGRRRLPPVLLATLLSWAYFVRPTNAIFILAVTAWVLWKARAQVLPYALTGAVWLALFMAWSWSQYGHALPSYYRAGRLGSTHFWEGLAGNLVSPSRGLFTLGPVCLWALAMGARRGREAGALTWCLLAGGAAQLVACSGFAPWNGGVCFGPRYSTELVPAFLLAAAAGIRGGLSRSAVAAGVVALGFSAFCHGRGATDLATIKWNVRPTNVDLDPGKVWNWRYPQALAGLAPMPEPTVWPTLAGQRLSFGAVESAAYTGDGWWMDPAEDFRYTDDTAATVRFSGVGLDGGDQVLRVRLAAATIVRKRPQRVTIELNGQALTEFTLKTAEPEERAVAVPAGLIRERNRLVFRLPDAVSPRRLGASSDARRLAIGVYWLEFTSPAR